MRTHSICGGKFNNLSISEEGGEAVLLYIPDVSKENHFHIRLSQQQVANLVDWLIDFQNK